MTLRRESGGHLGRANDVPRAVRECVWLALQPSGLGPEGSLVRASETSGWICEVVPRLRPTSGKSRRQSHLALGPEAGTNAGEALYCADLTSTVGRANCPARPQLRG